MTHDCKTTENNEVLKMINKFTLKSTGTIRYKIIACSSNCCESQDSCNLVRRVYFKPDDEHTVKCNGKSYAKFRTCPKAKNPETSNCQSEIHYAYISVLVEMNKDHVEMPVEKQELDTLLSKSAANNIRSTVYAKQMGEGCKIIKLVGIEFPACTSN